MAKGLINYGGQYRFTPSKVNRDPERCWLGDYFLVGKVTFEGLS